MTALAKTVGVGWFEIPVSNLARANGFYEAVFEAKLSAQNYGPVAMEKFPWEQGLRVRRERGSKPRVMRPRAWARSFTCRSRPTIGAISSNGTVAIEVVSDPARLRQFDLAILADV